MNVEDAFFRQVLNEFGPSLLRLARSYEHEPAKAEDLYQDICLALWKALPAWKREASLRTFVFRVAHNRGLTHGWSEGKRSTLPLQEAREALDPAPTAEETMDQKQRQQLLIAAVHRLPLGLKQTVALKLEGLSGPEIAEVLGISAGTARVRLHRAQKILARQLPSLFTTPSNTSGGDR